MVNFGWSGIGYIEYMAHSDSNYPRSVLWIFRCCQICHNGSLSIQSNHTYCIGITPQVVIDSNQESMGENEWL